MADADRERLKEILQKKSLLRGDFTLTSGKKSTYYIDARLTLRRKLEEYDITFP